MAPRNSEFLNRARRAREKLLGQLRDDPDVTLIDIGYASKSASQQEQIVLRVHVREQWFHTRREGRVAVPDNVDGIPVVVVRGDYRPGA